MALREHDVVGGIGDHEPNREEEPGVLVHEGAGPGEVVFGGRLRLVRHPLHPVQEVQLPLPWLRRRIM